MYRYTSTASNSFRRDAPTRLSYGAVAAYAFWLYAFGPAVALLRGELGFSYTLVGVYSAVWSAGAVVVGLCFAPVARRVGRRGLLWISALATAAGAGLFAGTHTIASTLFGTALMGFAGTMVLTLAQAVLSDRHGPRREKALVEANVGAGICAVAAPLALGVCQATPAGWHAAFAVPALALAALYVAFRRQRLSTPVDATPTDGRRTLPAACWLFVLLVAIGMAVEFCVVYFSTELLARTGLSTAQAAIAMSSFYVGLLVGRLVGAALSRTGRAATLLWVSLAVTAAGFLAFWLAITPALAIAGLLICGLGVANLYPLSLSLTLHTAPGRGDLANARTQLIGGLLVVAAPYLLGALADQIGLRAAFTIEPALLGLAAVLLLAGLRATRRQQPAM